MKTMRIKTGKRLSADDWVKEKEAMAPYVKRKSVNFTVSEELHLKFDVACTLNNTKMAWVLRKLIEGYVANTKNFK